MLNLRSKTFVFALAAPVLVVTASVGHTQNLSQIDSELRSHLDFRSLLFRSCLGQHECTVGDISLRAMRLRDDNETWGQATLYWDPIDGIGVQDGAQNDEIDFDERLEIRFAQPQTVAKVWYSDLFHTEDRRYGSFATDRVQNEPEDAEIAGMTLVAAGQEFGTETFSATDRLPWASFNQEVSVRFQENGDLRRRVIIQNEIVTVLAPSGTSDREDLLLQNPVGTIDKDKRAIFEGTETFEIDLAGILTEFHGTNLFAVGTNNFDLIERIAANEAELNNLRLVAERKRTSIQMSNGEVGAELLNATGIDGLNFFAPFDASNDFSVAGIILATQEG
ncbi:hypothetical protein Q4544_13995 [Cognatishimia sp. 1_MG-2023]|uniref:hypothetical protein n=1 Tax=Cognatishimia sp. 1_MG-2023 TaxID=3062642 RepID=UPI0026E36778|nr:hypothetical protein [Cognatishimia sp. 1_MG-2023]MDO6728047.1 hypothetical protein [Cognatishimia sp. 1_MG-2023]